MPIGVVEQKLHCAASRHIASSGKAPDLQTLSEAIGETEDETRKALKRLSESRGVILKPGGVDIWGMHPFTLMPTATWVAAGSQGWWANCAWCALGIGAAIGRDISIVTRLGAEIDEIKISVRSGRPDRNDLFVHFPRGPQEWWSNPFNPCGEILFFDSQSAIESWCDRHGAPLGQILPIQTVAALASMWFADALEPTWNRKSKIETKAIFDHLGLSSAFWEV